MHCRRRSIFHDFIASSFLLLLLHFLPITITKLFRLLPALHWKIVSSRLKNLPPVSRDFSRQLWIRFQKRKKSIFRSFFFIMGEFFQAQSLKFYRCKSFLMRFIQWNFTLKQFHLLCLGTGSPETAQKMWMWSVIFGFCATFIRIPGELQSLHGHKYSSEFRIPYIWQLSHMSPYWLWMSLSKVPFIVAMTLSPFFYPQI